MRGLAAECQDRIPVAYRIPVAQGAAFILNAVTQAGSRDCMIHIEHHIQIAIEY